jgi:hypothetical protein
MQFPHNSPPNIIFNFKMYVKYPGTRYIIRRTYQFTVCKKSSNQSSIQSTVNFSHVHGIKAQRYNSHSGHISVDTITITMIKRRLILVQQHVSQCSAAVNIRFSAYIYTQNITNDSCEASRSDSFSAPNTH